MAIKILQTRKDVESDNSIIFFQCDAEADVANLPTMNRVGNAVCAAGSSALVLNPAPGKSSIRRLTKDGVWVESQQRLINDCGNPQNAN